MSRLGSCYENASLESIWSNIKLQLAYRTSFARRCHAQSEIFNLIEVFYNRQRRHTSLGGHSTANFESKTMI